MLSQTSHCAVPKSLTSEPSLPNNTVQHVNTQQRHSKSATQKSPAVPTSGAERSASRCRTVDGAGASTTLRSPCGNGSAFSESTLVSSIPKCFEMQPRVTSSRNHGRRSRCHAQRLLPLCLVSWPAHRLGKCQPKRKKGRHHSSWAPSLEKHSGSQKFLVAVILEDVIRSHSHHGLNYFRFSAHAM